MLELGKVLIIGDSYSTFENCIPNGNAFWYYDGVDNNRTLSKKNKLGGGNFSKKLLLRSF